MSYIDSEARQDIAELRNQVGQLLEIVTLQGEHLLELQATLKDQDLVINALTSAVFRAGYD